MPFNCAGIGGLLGRVLDPRPMPIIQLHITWDPHTKTLAMHIVAHVYTCADCWPSHWLGQPTLWPSKLFDQPSLVVRGVGRTCWHELQAWANRAACLRIELKTLCSNYVGWTRVGTGQRFKSQPEFYLTKVRANQHVVPHHVNR